MKIVTIVTAAAVAAGLLGASVVQARPHHHGHKVCHTSWMHHHKVTHCSWR